MVHLLARRRAAVGPVAAPPSDDELVRRAQADPRQFALLYERYLDPIHAYCYRRLGSREAAEDATSVVFQRAFAALPRWRPPAREGAAGSFRSWLFAIAHNALTDQQRSFRVVERLDAAADVVAADPTPEEMAIAAEARGVVRGLLMQLSPDQRRVVELRLAGLTGPEIRDALGRSRAWVDTTQHRALLRLRAAMADEPSAKETDHGAR